MPELPTILTPRLRLRACREADLPRLAELAGATEIYRTTLRIPNPYHMEHARQFMQFQREAWDKGQAIMLSVALRETDEFMGGVGLEINRPMDRAELGFWIGVPYWNKGYITEAAGALLAFGFEHLKLNRIWAGHFSGNDASGRVQQKLGMKYEGVLRQALKKDGQYRDDVIYAVLREDFRPRVEWTLSELSAASAGGGEVRLETKRLLLRPTNETDLDDMMRVAGHMAVARNTGTIGHPFTLDDAKARLARHRQSLADRTGIGFAVLLKESGLGIGTTGFFGYSPEHGHAEVGYMFDPDCWGRGYATESLRAVVQHAFGEWGIRRLTASYFADNPASGRVLSKVGFQHEGTRRQHFQRFGEYRDDVLMGLLREEYQEERR